MSRTARVTFNYVAEQDDELSLETGDIIKNITDVDDGWCQGELNGKIGVFPNNFVEEVVTTNADVPATDSVAGKKAKVTFEYDSQDQDELTLKVGDIIDIIGEEETGWWRGQLANKTGVFPSNFVEIITDNNAKEPKDAPVEVAQKLQVEDSTPSEKKTVKNEYGDGLIDEEEPGIKRSSSIGAAAKKLPGGGMGFGNLINQNILAGKKLKKVHQDDRKETKSKTEEASAPTSEPPSKSSFGKTKAPMSAKARPAPPVPVTSPVKKTTERAKVTFSYEPENADELRLVEGEIVTILNKETTEGSGWWEGEVNGKAGMFPSNFVMLLTSEEEVKSSAPGKMDDTGLPLEDENVKSPSADGTSAQLTSPGRPDMKAPARITTEQPASKNPFPPPPTKADTERNTEAPRPTPAKKPQKPSVPPKKPLPKSKKPDVTAKKAEMKVDHSDKVPAIKKGTVNDDAKSEGKSIPDIKAENTDEAPSSFEEPPQAETLNHLTANRAKHLQKRPPSKEGRLSNAYRHSGDLEEELAEAIKEPPSRPKEPPTEPAWKREVREAKEKRQAMDEKAPGPAVTSKSDAVEKHKSWKSDEVDSRPPLVQRVEPFATGTPGEVDKLRKEVSELRELLSKMEKKHGDMIKKLREEFLREIESLTSDLDEERKKNAAEHAAHKVELDRLKRRQSRFSETQ